MLRKRNKNDLVRDTCAWCGQAAEPHQKFKKCTGCKLARYCGPVCQRTHWFDSTEGHKTPCKRVAESKCFSESLDAEQRMCVKIQDRLWRLEGYTRGPCLLPSGECTITSGHEMGPVKVVVDLDDGTTRTMIITDEPGIRPVTLTLVTFNEFNRGCKKIKFKTQADCARWHASRAELSERCHASIRGFVETLLSKFNGDFIWE